MKYFKKTILPIIIVGIWINISEIIRWELLIKSFWVKHYAGLNLVFPNEAINGIVWVLWGFLIAIIISVLSKKFSLIRTTLLSWFVVFVLLWMVLWNVNMLPKNILWYVVPLSLIELFIGAYIYKRLNPSY